MLRLVLLGGVRLGSGLDEYPVSLQPRMARLLAYLCLAERSALLPERLIERFWHDGGPEEGRACLHTALWRLRRVIRSKGLEWRGGIARGGTEAIDPPPIVVDVLLFRRSAEAALSAGSGDVLGTAEARALEQALSLYAGDLMPGVYDDWVLAERERLRELYVGAQLALLEHHASCGDLRRAIARGRAVLRLDPLRESVHRRLIELHLAAGEPGAALTQFKQCTELLARELAVRPAAATSRLVAGLAGARVVWTTTVPRRGR